MESKFFLLDTHVVVWAMTRPERLSGAAKKAIETGPVAVSVASLWEMVNKAGRATAPVADPVLWWRQQVVRREITTIPIRFEHVAQVQILDWSHRDPYDRILCAQALIEEATLITADKTIRANWTISTLW